MYTETATLDVTRPVPETAKPETVPRTPSPQAAPVDEEDAMAQERTGTVTFKGNPLTLVGPEIRSGQAAPGVFVVGKDGHVRHVEYVKEVTTEPNYEAALAAARSAAAN